MNGGGRPLTAIQRSRTSSIHCLNSPRDGQTVAEAFIQSFAMLTAKKQIFLKPNEGAGGPRRLKYSTDACSLFCATKQNSCSYP